MIIFAAFGPLLNLVFQSQQNKAVFLVLLMHYQQAFQRLVSAIRRRRVGWSRRRLRKRPWSWTLHSCLLSQNLQSYEAALRPL